MIPNKALQDREERLRQEFDRKAQAGPEPQEQYLQRLAEAAVGREPAADERVLEIGCGDGWLCRVLAPQCPEGAIVGIDISGEMIHLARERSLDFENVLHTLGSAEEIPWAEDYFTRVLSVETAYYWSSPERAAAEMFRVAAWGGRFDVLLSFFRENTSVHHWQELSGEPLLLQSEEEWIELFTLVGFHEVAATRVRDTVETGGFQAGSLWHSQQEWQAFHEAGALLISGRKPGLPPPGPLASEPERPRPPEPPDPLRILR
jgi:SAM-dependent methyltransferase